MSKHWFEKFDSKKHKNMMWGEGLRPPKDRDVKLDPYNVYFVRECGFTFEFHSMEQLEACIDHFSKKVRPSTIIPESEFGRYGSDHWERQRWYECLPKGLVSNHNRPKVLNALIKAKEYFTKHES